MECFRFVFLMWPKRSQNTFNSFRFPLRFPQVFDLFYTFIILQRFPEILEEFPIESMLFLIKRLHGFANIANIQSRRNALSFVYEIKLYFE